MIKDIDILPIYNSRGEQTIKVWVKTGKSVYTGSSPSGKSKGKWEAKTLDVKKVLTLFSGIKKNLIGMEEDFEAVDDLLEELGGKEFGKIGGNLSTAISIACIRATSDNNVFSLLNPGAKSLPYPLGNVIGGGAHGGFSAIQEFLVIPKKAKTIFDAIETNFSIWNAVGKHLKVKGFTAGTNDEGAWVARLNDLETLDILSKIAEEHEASIGIDIAGSQLYKKGYYTYNHLGKKFSSGEHLDFVKHLIRTYKLAYVEDPFHENDFKSFAELTKRVSCIVCGDDLFATRPDRLKQGIKNKAANSIMIKPNQVGTISKALEVIKLAKENRITPIIGHRSGETTDSFIADLAVGVEAPLIKCGISGGERTAKLNRLIEICDKMKRPQMTKLDIRRF